MLITERKKKSMAIHAFSSIFIVLSLFLPLHCTADPSLKISQKIIKIDTIDQLPLTQPEGTLFLFDLDDTLIDSPHMVGSRAWRQYMRAAVGKYWHDRLSLFLLEHIAVDTVEKTTAEIIKLLQIQGYPVCGFTARERHFWFDIPAHMDEITTQQLASVGIQFDSDNVVRAYPALTQTPEYYEGIIFSNVVEKGSYLASLLQSFPASSLLPNKVIFIDDKKYQIESVAAALEESGIDYECYLYRATDKKDSAFDPLIANIQLYHIWLSQGHTVLTDHQAAALALTTPASQGLEYLQMIIEEAKEKMEIYRAEQLECVAL